MLRTALAPLLAIALSARARAATIYVANNGVDGASCGPKTSPCRSISLAVNTNAADGDTIMVGPGKYGDLDRDGTLGDSPGEETGGFGCMVLIARPVTVVSTNGAGSTIIDARSVSTGCDVGIIVDGTTFGKPGKGFGVTQTKAVSIDGVQSVAMNAVIAGNQVIGNSSFGGVGIHALAGSGLKSALIEANQVVEWDTGIRAEADATTVRKNQVSRCFNGIDAHGASMVTANVMADNFNAGVNVHDQAKVTGNAFLGGLFGVSFPSDANFAGVVERNNFTGNHACGVFNHTGAAIVALNNYWGAATGPGPAPADQVGGGSCGTTTAAPFATKPFNVKAPIKP
jgi:hypothetical protein